MNDMSEVHHTGQNDFLILNTDYSFFYQNSAVAVLIFKFNIKL